MFDTGKMTMPVASSPCLDCPDRVIGCHGDCEKYKAFKEERLELNREIRKKTGRARAADTVIINGIQKRRNRYGRGKLPER